ncbi:YM54-like protein [Mya arenaria]|uniref:YM54-like protein n=1 Tax=Mya arenaria TaxID=6604 RepID=A0ABY7E309_MYAAR|nr:YM54-like protein [Mya arenaria]
MASVERERLKEDKFRKRSWKRWGPFLSERQWGTVREDYSADGDCWSHFPHEHARSRAYRWGEDGLFGVTESHCRLCLSLALWNGKDPILKERLFGLNSHQGNHGEDVKELYYYLDNTPTHSYMKALYKYPHAEFPYAKLETENARRGVNDPEYEILDTGVFNYGRYFDVTVEYCKASPNDILGRYTVANRGPERATVHVLPQLWYRNIWDWGEDCEAYHEVKPILVKDKSGKIRCEHPTLSEVEDRPRLNSMDRYVEEMEPPHDRASVLYHQTSVHGEDKGVFFFELGPDQDDKAVPVLFTENSTNAEKLYGGSNKSKYVKDAFHHYVINGQTDTVNPKQYGTKCAGHYVFDLDPGQEVVIKVRLYQGAEKPNGLTFGDDFDEVFQERIKEANEFYKEVMPPNISPESARIARQAFAGVLWNKQFYYYIIKEWMRGDAGQTPPEESRQQDRNREWQHLNNKDVISVPDKWEYPFYCTWGLALQMIPMAQLDIQFAKSQLILLLSEWYMQATGQLPAYESRLDDFTPPLHAYSVLKVYKASGQRGHRDELFLARWLNLKDFEGRNVVRGGFIGIDNFGIFDKSQTLSDSGTIAHANAIPWMGFLCSIMLEISLILAHRDCIYQDMASKFFEDFVVVMDSLNSVDDIGQWNEADGFFYDHVREGKTSHPVKIRSTTGFVPLLCCLVLNDVDFREHPGFAKRTKWFIENRRDLAKGMSFMTRGSKEGCTLLSMVNKEKLVRILAHMLDENKFLSPYGIRSLSKEYEASPHEFELSGETYRVQYEAGESRTGEFGGNTNWRGPVWIPMNFLIIENLRRFHYFYGSDLSVECPTGSGVFMDLGEVADNLACRLANIFLPDHTGRRPCHGDESVYAKDAHFQNLCLFYEYFNATRRDGQPWLQTCCAKTLWKMNSYFKPTCSHC